MEFISTLQTISLAVIGLIILSFIILSIKNLVTKSVTTIIEPTWGCGYSAPSPKLQYTANSFVRSFRKLVRPMMMMNKREEELIGVFPKPIHSETHPYDKFEAVFIDAPLMHLKGFIGKFKFLQNGNPQFYILYGIVFIFIILTFPLLLQAAGFLITLFKQI